MRRMSALLSVGLLSLVAAASADAAPRYASPTGLSTDPCSAVAPCDLVTAANSGVAGDEVIVTPGTYTLGPADTLFVPTGGSMHGIAGMARPQLISNAPTAVAANGVATTLTDLKVSHSGANSAITIGGTGTIADRIEVSSDGSATCRLTAGAIIRDSVCRNIRSSGDGIALAYSDNTGGTAYARNVTAIADGSSGYGVNMVAGSPAVTFDLRNVIAHGSTFDVALNSLAASSGNLALANSNWVTSATAGAGISTVTPAGSPTNQTTPPVFVNAAGGDYRQAADSPTIEAGLADAKTGPLDFEGQARSQGTSVDIGADEFAPAVVPPPPDTTAPQTSIGKGPKRKSKSTKATFIFSADEPGSTFACKLDKGSFSACTSPLELKRLKKGKHTFTVVATDSSGNADATAATYKWKVKRKRKK